MKKLILVLLGIISLMGMRPLYAEDPSVFIDQDNIRYKIWTSRGTAEIVYTYGILPDDLYLPDDVEYMGSNFAIKLINEMVFKGKQFKSVRLPGSLTKISNSVFRDCTQLQEIILPESLERIGASTFQGCRNLTEIFLPKNVISLGEDSFYGTGLQWVFNASDLDLEELNKNYMSGPDFPYKAQFVRADSLGTFDEFRYYVRHHNRYIFQMEQHEHLDLPLGYSFHAGLLEKYPMLTSVTVPEGTTELPFGIFAHSRLQTIDLPSTLTKVGDRAFYDCASLRSVNLPSSVVSIGSAAFAQCSSLQEITLPPLVTRLEGNTFASCTQLHTVGRLEEMESIGEAAFSQCESLTSAYLPKLTRIEDSTFSFSGLNEIVFSDSISYIGSYALSGCQFTDFCIPQTVKTIGQGAFYYNKKLAFVNLPEGLTELSQSLFAGCYALSQIYIPESVTTIRKSALSSTALQRIELHDGIVLEDAVFENCKQLKHVRLPASLSCLPDKTFKDCIALDSLCLGSDVTELGDNVVNGCTSLAYIRCDAVDPPAATNKTFANIDTYRCEVYVPEESVEAYLSAVGWRSFSHWNTAWSPDEPEPQYEELYHYNPYTDVDFYIATHNIGAQTGNEIGTRFESITNAEVEELCGAGWRLMTYQEAITLASGDLISLGLTQFFPNTYTDEYQTNADPGHVLASEYWIENDYVLFWGLYWGNRQAEEYVMNVQTSPRYQSELPVRPVRDDLPLGFSVLRELPHTVAVYDLNGRRNATARGMRLEVMSDGTVRKTIVLP